MYAMFREAINFTKNVSGFYDDYMAWDPLSVKDISEMFKDANSFSEWKVPNVS
jgi:hypothetical protein